MTDTTPELIEEISTRSEELSKKIEELEKFQSSIQDYQNRIENMNKAERESFFQSAAEIRDKASTASSTEELLELQQETEAAIRSPIENAATDAFNRFINLVEPELDGDQRDRFTSELGEKGPEQLEKIATTYEDICEQVNGSEEVIKSFLSGVVEDRPSILYSPGQELKQIVDRIVDQHEELKEIDNILKGAGDWCPKFEFSSTEQFYSEQPISISAANIESSINMVSETVEKFNESDISIDDAINEELQEIFESRDIREINRSLQSLRDDLSKNIDIYAEIHGPIEELERSNKSIHSLQSDLETVLDIYDSIDGTEFSDLDNLESIHQLEYEFEKFIQDLYERLDAQWALIEEIDDPSPPEHIPHRVSSQTGNRDKKEDLDLHVDPVSLEHVKQNPVEAIEECNGLHEYIRSELYMGSETAKQEMIVETWQSLAQGDSIEITDQNQDAVLALAERLSLEVSISDE